MGIQKCAPNSCGHPKLCHPPQRGRFGGPPNLHRPCIKPGKSIPCGGNPDTIPAVPVFPDKGLFMRCPFCRHDETKVIDSRNSQDYSIRRRRECLSCSRRFTTYERIEESPIKVIKKDGTRIPFDRNRIRAGIEKACYKRPISNDQIDKLVAEVESSIYEDGLREIPSRQIGEMVFKALRDLDKVAFVRFASVYREFKDVNDFVDELQPILEDRPD